MTTTNEARRLTTAETAKLVRGALKDAFKKAFPSVRFSVRSDNYAGGSSVRVTWTDGPSEAEVTLVTRLFEGADFDGMQDLKTYKRHTVEVNGEAVLMGADFVMTSRDWSDETREALLAELGDDAPACEWEAASAARRLFFKRSFGKVA